MFALRAALLFCTPMLVNGIGLPYFSVFLDYLGMTSAEIGIVLAVPHLVRLIGTPLGAIAADRASDRTLVLRWSAIVALFAAVALFFAHSFWAVLIIFALQSLFYAPFAPIAEAIIITGVRRWGCDYGFLRSWGSVAFVVSTLLGGWLLGKFGGAMVVPSMAAFSSLMVMMAFLAPRVGRMNMASAVAPMRVFSLGNPLWRLDFVLVVAGAALVQGSHGMLFSFASIYWERMLGFNGTQIGVFWTAGVIAEIFMFVLATRVLSRFSHWALILAGCSATVARWIIFPHITGFLPHLSLQATHALTFASIHIGIQRFIILRIDENQESSAQGFYTTFIALFSAFIVLLSGQIYGRFGIAGLNFMAALAMVGLLMVLAAMLRQPHRALSGG